jgi:uncharacterized protein (DUF4415 family)
MITKPKRPRGQPPKAPEIKRRMVSMRLRPEAIDRLRAAGQSVGGMGRAVENLLGL